MAPILHLLYEQGRRRHRIPRLYHERKDPRHYMTNREILSKYRFPSNIIHNLVCALTPHLQRPTERNHALSPSLITAIALRFYATGAKFNTIGDVHGVHKMSVSRAVEEVSLLLATKFVDKVHFTKNPQKLRSIALGFAAKGRHGGIPSIIGAIDGSHIRIKAPKEDEQAYISRKNFHSINMQAVCDHQLLFTNVVIKFPGSTHDAFIWNTCDLKDEFEQGVYERYWLLGDSAYTNTIHLCTPITHPRTEAEFRFNRCHCATRNVIERAFGVLKLRFLSLHSWGGTLLFEPPKACLIIMACIILHNVATKLGLPIQNDAGNEIQLNDLQALLAAEDERFPEAAFIGPADRDGHTARENIVARLRDN